MTIDDDELRRLDDLAQKATPGPWVAHFGGFHVGPESDQGLDVCSCDGGEDGQFIAEANPQTVRDLIADLRAGRERWRKLREWLGAEGFSGPYDQFAINAVSKRMDELEAGT